MPGPACACCAAPWMRTPAIRTPGITMPGSTMPGITISGGLDCSVSTHTLEEPRARQEITMARIDESRPFLPVNIAVMTVSDTRTAANDTSGDTLAERIAKAGHRVVARV